MATAPVPAPAPAAAAGGGASAKSTSTKSAAKTVTKKKVIRKVKKPGTKIGISAAQLAFAASRSAQMDLANLRNDAAARRMDPLWYKAEDILPSVADDTLMSESATKVLPEQIQVVEAALGMNNLTRSDVTPQAFACLLEQARRYAMEILTDSQDYAFVAGRTEIAAADLALANEFRPDHPMAVSTQVPKLNLLSQTVNRTPLPPIPTQCYSGVLLPPKHHQLTARTFDVVTSAQTARRMVQAAPPPPHKVKTGKKKKSKDDKNKPSYGAARGRQISVNLKSNAKKDEGENAPEKKTETGTAKTDAATKAAEQPKPAAADEGKDKPALTAGAAPAATTTVTKASAKKDDSMDVDNKDVSPTATSGTATEATSTTAPPPAAGDSGAAPMETSPSKP